jgi:ribonuclease HI
MPRYNSILDFFKTSDPLESNVENSELVIIKKNQNNLRREYKSMSVEESNNFLKQFGIKPLVDENPIIENLVKKYETIEIYTDGSCIGNGQRDAKAGIGVLFPNGEYSNISERFLDTPTNQRAELFAIYKALTIVLNDIKLGTKIIIYSDSEYSIKVLKEYCRKWSINNWCKSDKKPAENLDIIKPLYSIYTQYWNLINLIHVRSHTGKDDIHSINNDKVDYLAKKGATS